MTGARDRDPVGIIGAGHLGRALARAARRAGRSVVIANSRGPRGGAGSRLGRSDRHRRDKPLGRRRLERENIERTRRRTGRRCARRQGREHACGRSAWLRPHESGGRRVIFISGDDADAKADVVRLFEEAGFAGIDLGDLSTGGAMQQIHHPLPGVNLLRLAR